MATKRNMWGSKIIAARPLGWTPPVVNLVADNQDTTVEDTIVEATTESNVEDTTRVTGLPFFPKWHDAEMKWHDSFPKWLDHQLAASVQRKSIQDNKQDNQDNQRADNQGFTLWSRSRPLATVKRKLPFLASFGDSVTVATSCGKSRKLDDNDGFRI